MNAQLNNSNVSFACCWISRRKISGLEILCHFECFVDLILDLRVISPLDCLNFSDPIIDELPRLTYFLGMPVRIVQIVYNALLRLGIDPVSERLDSPPLVILRRQHVLVLPLAQVVFAGIAGEKLLLFFRVRIAAT